MTHEKLLNEAWFSTVELLGGAPALEKSARELKAFLRARGFENALDMLRMILAYCLSGGGLRSTAAWAASAGLADVANTALLYRLRQSGDWLAWLGGKRLHPPRPKQARAGQSALSMPPMF
jgi:hypothetical protein